MRVNVAIAALSVLLAGACPKKSDPPGPAPGGPLTTGAGGTAPTGGGTPGAGAGGSLAGTPGTSQGGMAGGTATGAGGAGVGGAGAGVACGPKTCAVGQICCNASCGICTPPDGFCTQQLCNEGDAGATGTACKADGDCRLFSDYCTGCDCRALGANEKNPICSGPGVRCIRDPCDDKRAACQGGRCAAVTANRR